MNILVLSNSSFNLNQGSGYIILNTIECFKLLGHTVIAIDNTKLKTFKWFKGHAIRYRTSMGMALFVLRNGKLLRSVNLIVFYGAEGFAAIWVLRRILKFKGKIILHSNGIELLADSAMNAGPIKLNRYSKFFQWNMHPLFRYTYRQVDGLFVLSDYEKKFAVNTLKVDRVFTLEPAIDSLFLNNQSEVTPRLPIITFCASWIPRKGIEPFRIAMTFILKKYPNYSLRLIGVGKSFKVAESFDEGILNRIEVIPFETDKEKLAKMFQESQIFVLPSIYESFGLVIVEAMCCGCAIVSGNTGIGASLEHGETALVLDTIETSSLQNSIELLITNKDLMKKIATKARSWSSFLTWDSYRIKLDEAIKSICN